MAFAIPNYFFGLNFLTDASDELMEGEALDNTAMTLAMTEALGTAPTFSLSLPSPNPHPALIPFPNPYPAAMEECAEVESDGGSFSGAPIGPYILGNGEEPEIINEELAQPFGVNAVGTTVCREFGTDGVFYGVITAYRRSKGIAQDLYQVEYTDGDVEDMDGKEYSYAYALWLKEEGWNGEEYEPDAAAVNPKRKQNTKPNNNKSSTVTATSTKKKRKATTAQQKMAKLQEVVDLTAKGTIAGKHISLMDADRKSAVVSLLTKTAKKTKIE